MIVACKSTLMCAKVYVSTRGAHENFEFRSSQIAADTIWEITHTYVYSKTSNNGPSEKRTT